ncbi:GH92 family glycosyl hydrolase [Leifsonia flava]|nr:GH92 family glycosyl hydrolase [Leifsonia flava]
MPRASVSPAVQCRQTRAAERPAVTTRQGGPLSLAPVPHRPRERARGKRLGRRLGRRSAASVTASVTAVLVAAASFALPVSATSATAAPADDYSSLVNPFVGTESEGNAYPGATRPFGMVQLSPDNTNSYQSTSYSADLGSVWGFSHRHINSAGCPAAGEVLVTPGIAEVPRTTRSLIPIEEGTESAEAGYYAVTLDDGVTAELTATERTGVHRYTFPASQTSAVSFNVGQTLRDAGASSVTWVDDHTLEGWVDNSGFCGGSEESRYFFSAQFDRPTSSSGIWSADGAHQPGVASNEVAGGDNGAVAVFDTTDDADVEISVGVSFVDVDGARANRVSEVGENATPFDEVRAATKSAWNDQLGSIAITASEQTKRVFYTQLYKSLLSPTIGSDVDGRYRGMDLAVHVADGWTYHQTFSLWDTYRTQATLHGLIERDRASDIVRSMYQHRIEGGWLPRWSLGPVETNIMAGDPASAWVAENFALGTVPDDISDELWDVLVENATTAPPEGVASVGRQSADFWIKNRHIPYYSENEPGLGQQFEEYRHGGSSSLEFSISDAAIGAAAQRMGKTEEAAPFLERGRNWQRLWNPDVALSGGFTGIVNAVTPEGEFVTTGENASVQESGFHEGTAWQYQWMANQDFAGLQDVMGGTDQMLSRLDFYFGMDELKSNPGVSPTHWAPGGSTYYTSIGYNPGNEPTIMNPWLYSSVGQPAKVNDVLAANLNRFGTTPGGGVGNDDLGTLASWYVMASLGFAPVVPGSGMFAMNAPRVEQATITLDDGNTIDITAPGASDSQPRYIESVSVDGVDTPRTWFDLDDIKAGGSLDFTLASSSDGLAWGTEKANRLPSVAAPQRVTPQITPATGGELTAGTAKVLDVATVAFGDTAASEVPITATASFGGDLHGLQVREQDGAWVLSLEAKSDSVGTQTAAITVTSAADVPRFAPTPFEPATAEASIAVVAGSTPPVTDPEPPTEPSGDGDGNGGDGAGNGGDGSDTAAGPNGDLASTGFEIVPGLLAALAALLAGALLMVVRRRQVRAGTRRTES